MKCVNKNTETQRHQCTKAHSSFLLRAFVPSVSLCLCVSYSFGFEPSIRCLHRSGAEIGKNTNCEKNDTLHDASLAFLTSYFRASYLQAPEPCSWKDQSRMCRRSRTHRCPPPATSATPGTCSLMMTWFGRPLTLIALALTYLTQFY